MKKPKMSIIVPVYNTEKYLRNCLDSLVSQTLQDVEIVVVNDGSKDSSLQIIEEYKALYPDKVIVVNQENQGQAVARNKAIEVCTGEYIGFLDSDDASKPRMFETMYNAAVKAKADMVVCDYEFITGTKTFTKHVKAFRDQKDMFIDCFVDPWNKVFRAEVLKNNGVRFPEGYFYEDTGWFIMCIPFVKVATKVDEVLVEHYKRDGSSMTALDDHRVEHIFPVLQKVLDFYKGNGVYNDYKDELEYFCSKILLCSSFRRISRVRDKGIRKKLVNRTFGFLKDNFPGYRANAYYKGKPIKSYIVMLSPLTDSVVLAAYRCLNMITEWREK